MSWNYFKAIICTLRWKVKGKSSEIDDVMKLDREKTTVWRTK